MKQQTKQQTTLQLSRAHAARPSLIKQAVNSPVPPIVAKRAQAQVQSTAGTENCGQMHVKSCEEDGITSPTSFRQLENITMADRTTAGKFLERKVLDTVHAISDLQA